MGAEDAGAGPAVTTRVLIGLVIPRVKRVLFFFQAEDGIRDYKVTGVQTCALPIFEYWHGVDVNVDARLANGLTVRGGTSVGRRIMDNCEIRAKLPEISPTDPYCRVVRSEERRVGKECRERGTGERVSRTRKEEKVR